MSEIGTPMPKPVSAVRTSPFLRRVRYWQGFSYFVRNQQYPVDEPARFDIECPFLSYDERKNVIATGRRF